jgi:hypothetical protein
LIAVTSGCLGLLGKVSNGHYSTDKWRYKPERYYHAPLNILLWIPAIQPTFVLFQASIIVCVEVWVHGRTTDTCNMANMFFEKDVWGNPRREENKEVACSFQLGLPITGILK